MVPPGVPYCTKTEMLTVSGLAGVANAHRQETVSLGAGLTHTRVTRLGAGRSHCPMLPTGNARTQEGF